MGNKPSHSLLCIDPLEMGKPPSAPYLSSIRMCHRALVIGPGQRDHRDAGIPFSVESSALALLAHLRDSIRLVPSDR